MANLKLSELNVNSNAERGDLLYIVDASAGLSKAITIQDLVNNLPAGVKITRGDFDIAAGSTSNGAYLSGGQPIETSLSNTFRGKTETLVLELINTDNDPLTFPTSSDDHLSGFGGYTIALSGNSINGAVPQRLVVKVDERYIGDNFSVKFVQSGALPIFLSGGPNAQFLTVNNTLSSGPTFPVAIFPDHLPQFPVIELTKLPTSNDSGGSKRFLINHSLSCNGVGTAIGNWNGPL